MKDYDEFYISRRLKLRQKIGFLSGGLKAVPLFLNDGKKKYPNLITYSNNTHIMGGSYIWVWDGNTTISRSGSKIPVYSNPTYMGEYQLFPIMKADGTILMDYFIGKNFGYITIFHRTAQNTIEIDEERTEIFGAGLFEAKINTISISTILAQDLNGNGQLDLLIGENDWSEYKPEIDGKSISWGSEEYVPFDDEGNYLGGLCHGKVHVLKGIGLFDENDEALMNPREREKDQALDMIFGGKSQGIVNEEPQYMFKYEGTIEGIDVYGYSTPCTGDFRNNQTRDLVTGNFIRDITYFKQKSAEKGGESSAFNKLQFEKGEEILEMQGVINTTISIDLNHSGFLDLVIGSENGHIYFAENTGKLNEKGIPIFLEPIPLMQTNPPLKSDILPVPSIGELRKGHLDMICGNGAGLFDYFTDLDFSNKSATHLGEIKEIPRILPPIPQGSIQGPTEIGWGYICSKLFDWTGNGLLDIVFSDTNGDHQVSVNIGDEKQPKFQSPKLIIYKKNNKPLKTVWRVKPALYKHTKTSEINYVCLDDMGFLTMYTKTNDFELGNKRYVRVNGQEKTKLTKKFGGSLGRVKLTFMDWNGNGLPDILMGVPGSHNFRMIKGNEEAEYFPNSRMAIMINDTNDLSAEKWSFKAPRYLYHLDKDKPIYMGNHTCAPEPFSKNGETYIIVGAEDGQFYQFKKEEFEIR